MSLVTAFVLSGSVYVMMEIMLDNTSHRSMFFAGGIAFIVCRLYIGLPYVVMSILMAVTILVIEYIFGIVFNKYHTIWDYRKYKWNIGGQICFRFFLLWLVLMPPVIMYLDELLNIIFN